MIESNTITHLVSTDNIKKINEECNKRGLTELRIYQTFFEKDKDFIHFLANDPDYSTPIGKKLNLFILSGLEELIGELLHNKVKLVLTSQLQETTKVNVLQNAIPYQIDQTDNITQLFNNKIVPFSQKDNNNPETKEEYLEEKNPHTPSVHKHF